MDVTNHPRYAMVTRGEEQYWRPFYINSIFNSGYLIQPYDQVTWKLIEADYQFIPLDYEGLSLFTNELDMARDFFGTYFELPAPASLKAADPDFFMDGPI